MDQWKKLHVLDAGSFGKVYYVVNIHPSSFLSASVAAVKCVDMHHVSIDNDNIPTYNLFLEYASDGSLHDLINNYKRGMRKMSELEVGFYTYQILKGIQHIHKKGWVHCHANVLVLDNAERGGMHKLKLTDFGLSLRVPKGVAYIYLEVR
ncbi:hypothetical protein KY285_033730 [Solanum tuberosum]|nr:hypothetical protein KY284_033574 [Solanum tuberosum]KAH0648482.1 hypothetical protein KY285_033730 [Solanum tuberosum]